MNEPVARIRRVLISLTLITTGLLVAAFLIVAGLRVAAPGLRDTAAQPITTRAGSVVFLRGCTGDAEKEPTTIPTWCTSGDGYWSDLQWSSWNADGARAVGVEVRNSCDCAAGTMHSFPIRLRLTDPVTRDGVRSFRGLVITYPRQRPAQFKPVVRYRDVRGGWLISKTRA